MAEGIAVISAHLVDGLGRWWLEYERVSQTCRRVEANRRRYHRLFFWWQCASRDNSSGSRLPNALRRTDSSRSWNHDRRGGDDYFSSSSGAYYWDGTGGRRDYRA